MNSQEYITKEYFEKTLDARFELSDRRIRQYMKDLTSGFQENLKVFGNQIQAVDDRLSGKIDNLENRFNGLENRFDGLEGRFDGLEGRFDRLENRFDSLESMFHNLETEVRIVAKDVVLIKDVLEGKADQQDHLKVEKRVTKLELKFST